MNGEKMRGAQCSLNYKAMANLCDIMLHQEGTQAM